MEPLFIAGLFGILGGSIGGYALSSHIHSVASTATSNTIISGAAAAITSAITTVQHDVKALAAKLDLVATSAPVAAPKVIPTAPPVVTPVKPA